MVTKEPEEHIGSNTGIQNYVLVNDRHRHFNIWLATTEMGHTYLESFRKGYDPNIRLKNKKMYMEH